MYHRRKLHDITKRLKKEIDLLVPDEEVNVVFSVNFGGSGTGYGFNTTLHKQAIQDPVKCTHKCCCSE